MQDSAKSCHVIAQGYPERAAIFGRLPRWRYRLFLRLFLGRLLGTVVVIGVAGAAGVVGVDGAAAGPQAAISSDSAIKPLTASQRIFPLIYPPSSLFVLFPFLNGKRYLPVSTLLASRLSYSTTP